MTKFLNLILVLLLLSCDDISSSGKTDTFLFSEKTTDTLQIELEIKSEEIKNLEDIKAEFRLKNISDEEVIYGFSSGCQYGYTVMKDQNTVFDSRKNLFCTAATSQLKIEPNETKFFPISLDIFNTNEKLDSGIYDLKAFLLGSDSTKITTLFKVE